MADLVDTLGKQVAYHKENRKRSQRIERRLDLFGLAVLAVTLMACLAHLVVGVGMSTPLPLWAQGDVLFFSGFLPAVGAATAGVSNQGEFRRMAKRSAAMEAQLGQLRSAAETLSARLDSPTVPRGIWRECTSLASRATKIMINEVLDWRVVFLDEPLRTT